MHSKYRLLHAVKVIVLIAVALTVVSAIVMRLWNTLLPELFGWHTINFAQALGLLVLSRILFGGIRGPSMWGPPWMHHMRQRWEKMTPEEREKFREILQTRRGFFGGRCSHEPAQKEKL